jgi:hypothetical protein
MTYTTAELNQTGIYIIINLDTIKTIKKNNLYVPN